MAAEPDKVTSLLKDARATLLDSFGNLFWAIWSLVCYLSFVYEYWRGATVRDLIAVGFVSVTVTIYERARRSK